MTTAFFKNLGTATILLFLRVLSFAQTPEPVIAKVYYKFSYQYDTTNVNLVKKENYVLLLGKFSSVYRSYDRALQDSEMIANYKKTGMMVPPIGPRADANEHYYYYKPDGYYIRVRDLGDYILKIPFNSLNWKIVAEKQKISNLDCQKATASYRGRNYVAWFTTALPFHAGPWKLHGLPGLIVTAYDKTGRIKFDFNGFEQVKNTNEETALSKKSSQISVEDYKKLAKAYENDPKNFISGRFGRGTVTTSTPLRHINVLKTSSMVNFPLEVLPDSTTKK